AEDFQWRRNASMAFVETLNNIDIPLEDEIDVGVVNSEGQAQRLTLEMTNQNHRKSLFSTDNYPIAARTQQFSAATCHSF
ncbi:MAG: hypothetical protein ACPGSN_11140, partial [Psychrobium sp.]